MKKCIFFVTLVLILVSCASVPVAQYDAVKAVRQRATKFPAVPKYSPQDFAAGEEQYNQATQLINTKKELKKVPDMLTAANDWYTKVINSGMPAYAADLEKEIDGEFKTAQEIKANVALKSQYDAVKAQYDAAKALSSGGVYDEQLAKFEAIIPEIQKLTGEAKQQYTQSFAAVEKLKQKLNELNTVAQEIDGLSTKK